MKKGSAKRVSSLPSNAEFNLGGLYHALRIATVRSSDSLWVPFDKEGKCCKVIHSPTQPQYVETICCLLYTNDELNLTIYLHEIEEREGISILGQINDSLIDDSSPAPSGGFGNPFNDPNWEQHITSFFGKREDVGIPGKDTTNHNGLDIAYPYGTPILAVEAGTVIKAGYHVSYGNYLVINHGGGYCTLYAHCSQLLAQVGDTVNKYDTIAKVGATGDVTGNHLHICVIVDGVYVNPKGYLH